MTDTVHYMQRNLDNGLMVSKKHILLIFFSRLLLFQKTKCVKLLR